MAHICASLGVVLNIILSSPQFRFPALLQQLTWPLLTGLPRNLQQRPIPRNELSSYRIAFQS